MRFVSIDSVTDEVVLARNVPSERPDGAALLRAGTKVNPSIAARLAGSGIRGAWIDDELGLEITPPPEFPADVIGIALQATRRALEAAPVAIGARRELDIKLVRSLQDAAGEIADAVLAYPANECPVADFAVAVATAPWHAVRVAVLGTFIGRRELVKSGWIDYQGVQRFDGFDERLSALAMGLLVHDIGVPPWAAGLGTHVGCMAPESEQDPDHVHRGASLFAAESTAAAMRVAIRSHHERWDGQGFPDRKCRDATAINARIAAIADAYDGMIATGVERRSLPGHGAVQSIERGSATRFDPSLVAHFKALVPPHPVGHEVHVPDGRVGVVVKLPHGDRLHPTVRLRSASGPIVEFVADMTAGEPSAAAA